MTPGEEDARRRLSADPQAIQRLEKYAAMLAQWTRKINLVAPSTLPFLWERHFLDSAQLLDFAPVLAKRWVDLGSGGGFPGMVIAILAADRRPDLQMILVESDQRKSAFLRSVSRETGVPVQVIAARAEDLPPQAADIVSARALAPLPRLLQLAYPHLSPSGLALFPKGETVEAELGEALANWSFTVHKEPSLSHDKGIVLCIGDIVRV